MIKKKILLSILLIITISTCVYANTMMNKPVQNEIVSVSSQQVGIGSEFYLILNLSNISFTKFKVDIVNTESLTMNEVTSEVSSLSSNNVVTTFTVDKTTIGLDKLGIIFTAPNQVCKINFDVKITSLDTSVDDFREEQVTLQLEIDQLNDDLTILKNEFTEGVTNGILIVGTTEYKEKEEEIASVDGLIKSKETEISELEDKIINFKAETLESNLWVEVSDQEEVKKNEEMDKAELEEEMEKSMKEMTEMSEKMQNLESNLNDAKDTISSLTKNVTYQGSQNNYLKSLSITGIEFDNSFRKTTNTYFATVDKTVEKVTVNAVAEDSTAIVTIYGNTDLEEGQNKVLITVTADDGSVRTYKIYITK